MRGKALELIKAIMPEDYDTPYPIQLGDGYQLAWMPGYGPRVWTGIRRLPNGSRPAYLDIPADDGIITE